MSLYHCQLHCIKPGQCTLGDNCWLPFLLLPSFPPVIVFSNPFTSHTNTQSCRRNKKKSRGQLKPNTDMLYQTHQHLHNLTSHIVYHTTSLVCQCKYFSYCTRRQHISDTQPLCLNVRGVDKVVGARVHDGVVFNDVIMHSW